MHAYEDGPACPDEIDDAAMEAVALLIESKKDDTPDCLEEIWAYADRPGVGIEAALKRVDGTRIILINEPDDDE